MFLNSRGITECSSLSGINKVCHCITLSWWLSSKESICNTGDKGLSFGSGRDPGEENDNPLQYSCLENLMDRGAWRATVHGVAKELDMA